MLQKKENQENLKTAFAIVGFAFFMLVLYWWIFDKGFKTND
jgi:hypothetical protein